MFPFTNQCRHWEGKKKKKSATFFVNSTQFKNLCMNWFFKSSSFNAWENLEFLALIFECTDPQKSYFQLTTIVMCKSYCAEKFVSKLPKVWPKFLIFFMKSALYSGLLDKFLQLKFLWQLFHAFCPLFPENPKNIKDFEILEVCFPAMWKL